MYGPKARLEPCIFVFAGSLLRILVLGLPPFLAAKITVRTKALLAFRGGRRIYISGIGRSESSLLLAKCFLHGNCTNLPKVHRTEPDAAVVREAGLNGLIFDTGLYFFVEKRGFGMAKLEKTFQHEVIKELKEKFPGCVVLKNDPTYIQGFPDITILYKRRWAALETKRSENESHRPNQDYYVEKLGKMSYSSFIFPENKAEVFNELEQTLKPRRKPRVSKREQVQLAEQDQ